MTERDKYSWTSYGRLCTGGHKLFRDRRTERWAICDDSGETPDKAEDGVLWVRTDTFLRLADSTVQIPLKTEDGKLAWGIESLPGAMVLMEVTGMEIVFEGLKLVCSKVGG